MKRKMALVIDEPATCDDCGLDSYCGCFCNTRRHPECPLRPVPEKLKTEGKEPLKRAAGYAFGWNDCIDEIGGREDGKAEIQAV